MRPSAVAALLVLVALLAACAPPEATPRVVDFVQLGDRRYVRVDGAPSVPAPPKDTLGPVVGAVARTVGDPKGAPLASGDAAYLDPGTPLHAVPGFEPWFRLAAVMGSGEIALYELSTRASARTGADLLDLSGGIVRVSVEDRLGKELGHVDDPAAVGAIVDGVLQAPVESIEPSDGKPSHIVVFWFDGAPPVRRPLFAPDASLAAIVHLDPPTLCAIERAAGSACTG